MKELVRCPWCLSSPLMMRYHDTEWGVPVHDDRRLFEFLILEGAQAGLSWAAVLKRRESYRAAFDQFDPKKIARYDSEKTSKLLADPGIIRNRLKVAAAIKNAAAFLALQKECGSFDAFLWEFVKDAPVVNRPMQPEEIPSRTAVSDRLSVELQNRGFVFVGSTICYAFMQAVGLVNDHLTNCFRSEQASGFAAIV